MDRTQIIGAIGLIASLTVSSCGGGGARAIRVGSKNFTEQVVLGEIIAQQLENRLHVPVDRRLNLGGTLLAHQALVSGEIDLYPEYTGTAIGAILKQPMDSVDPGAVLGRVRAGYERFQVEWLDPLGIDNGFAMVIRGDQARSQNIAKLSDAARTGPWQLGAGYEFEQRADGLAALNKTYGLRWKESPKSMDLGLLFRALDQGQVSMIAANATDGPLSAMDVKVLEDDQHAFPPYQVCVALRRASQNSTPGLRDALLALSGKFTNQKMQQLNYQVDVMHKPVGEVAAAFLKDAGLK